MARTKENKRPSAMLATIIDDLTIYNGLYFRLRQGTKMLLDAIETESVEKIKAVANICKLREVLEDIESDHY